MALSKIGVHAKKNITNASSKTLWVKMMLTLRQLNLHNGSESAETALLSRQSQRILREIESKKSQAIAIVYGFQKC